MTAQDGSQTPATTRVEAIVEFLEGEGIEYEVIEHEPTMSAAAEAKSTRHPTDQVAKTVVLRDGGGYMIAAIPASERLDLHWVLVDPGEVVPVTAARTGDICQD